LNYFEKFTKTITKTEEEFMATIVLIGSLDTKGREYDYVRTYLKDAGANVIVVDFGILGTPFFSARHTSIRSCKRRWGKFRRPTLWTGR